MNLVHEFPFVQVPVCVFGLGLRGKRGQEGEISFFLCFNGVIRQFHSRLFTWEESIGCRLAFFEGISLSNDHGGTEVEGWHYDRVMGW